MSKSPAKKFIVETDNEGALPITPEMEPDVKIGDEYATWNEGDKIMLVFLKNYCGKRKIPKSAYRGKVEPALPKIPVTLPKPAKAEKVKSQKRSGRSTRKK